MALMARNPSLRLRQAVQKNDLNLVTRLRYKTDLRNTDERRLTSLAWAALSVAEDVYEWLLLDAGHDDDELSRDSENSTILHLLASLPSPDTPGSATERKKMETFQAAVRMSNMYWDVFPDLIDWSNAAGKTALHMACQSGNTELVRTLCELGADLQLTDLQGNSPLHYASAWNNLGSIKVLLEFGAPASSRNNDAFTALDYAFSTTLSREFALAMREASEARRVRRMQGTSGQDSRSNSNSGAGLGPGSTGYFRTLANKGSFVTVFSDEAGGRNRVGSPSGPSTPPQFQLTTPEAKSPSSSMGSLPSDRQAKQVYPEQGLAPARQTPRKDQGSYHTSPHLSPTPPPTLPRNQPSEMKSLEPRRMERSSSNRSTPSEDRSRVDSSLGSRRPNIPAIHIPDSHKISGERRKSTELVRAEDAQPRLHDSPVSMRSVVPPPRSNVPDSLALGRPL